MLAWLDALYDVPTCISTIILICVVLIFLVKKERPTQEPPSGPVPPTQPLTLIPMTGPPPSLTVPLPPPSKPPDPAERIPAPIAIETLPFPMLKEYVALIDALMETFEQASITIPAAYMPTLKEVFAEVYNLLAGQPDERGRVKLYVFPAGFYPYDEFRVV
jgi:hypothetical protein